MPDRTGNWNFLVSGANSRTIEIGFATAADLPRLVELLALVSDFQPARDKQLRGLCTILDNPAASRLFVLRIDRRVADMANALITISTAKGGRVLLEDVIVRREHQDRYRNPVVSSSLVSRHARELKPFQWNPDLAGVGMCAQLQAFDRAAGYAAA